MNPNILYLKNKSQWIFNKITLMFVCERRMNHDEFMIQIKESLRLFNAGRYKFFQTIFFSDFIFRSGRKILNYI